MLYKNTAHAESRGGRRTGLSHLAERGSVPPVNRILRKTMLIMWLLVIGGLFATTVLTSRALYNWEMATVTSVVSAANNPAKMAVESLDKRRGQALTDGILKSGGIYQAILIDDYGEALGQSAKPPPKTSVLMQFIRLFWPESIATIVQDVPIYDGRHAQLSVEAVLGNNTGGLVEASLLILISQAVLITIVAAWTIHSSATMPLVKGLRVLSDWVRHASLEKDRPLPPAQSFKFSELFETAAFIQRILGHLFDQKQDLAKTVQDLEVQINLNKQYIHIINQILTNSNKTAVHIDKTGNITVYNRDTFIRPLFDQVSPALFRRGADAFIEQLKASDQVQSVTQLGDCSKQHNNGRLLMSIDVTLTDGRIIEFKGLDLGLGETALMISDQTEIRAFAQENFQRQKLEAIGVLASGVAHDLNNVLAIISGSIELELKQRLDTESSRNLKTAYGALEHGSSVVRSLLRFSRKDVEEVETHNAKAIIDDLLLLVKGKIGGKIEIQSSVQNPDANVRVDRSRLANALLNLAINAGDAIEGQGRIDIIMRDATDTDDLPGGSSPEDFVVFQVSDNGPGIPDHIRSRIMDPFFTTKSRDKGTGLGLSLVYTVAETFGGKLSFRNNPDVGASFMIALPKASPDANLKAKAAATPDVGSTPRDERVLFVEDETRIATLVKKYLSTFGYEVTNAGSVSAARELVQSGAQFDVIVTDLNLGDGTGFEVANLVQSHSNPPPVILISGNLEYGAFDEPASLFAGSLEKPFAMSALEAMIRDCVENAENAVPAE